MCYTTLLASWMRRSAAAVLACIVLLLFGSTAAYADAALQSFVEKALAWLQDRDQNPAIAALVQIDGKIAAEVAIGRRALGHPESVTVGDRWHIGSDTKAFTATLIGTLVDRQALTWDDTLEASLPALAKTMHPWLSPHNHSAIAKSHRWPAAAYKYRD